MSITECSMDKQKPDTLLIVCQSKMAYEGLKEPERLKQLQGILNERVRKEVKFELVLDESGGKYDKIPHSKTPNMAIETDDSFSEEEF